MLARLGKWWGWIVGFIAAVASILAVLDFFLKWGILAWFAKVVRDFANLLIINWVAVVFVVFAFALLVFWRKLYVLEDYVAIGFKDDFKRDLRNWNYTGSWMIVPGGDELSVTDSHIGGITNVGHLWTDYSFEFTAVIVNDRIGWIVRAQDQFNYYMIQLTPSLVRPHLLIGGNWVVLAEVQHAMQINLNEPMRIRTEVRGSEIRVYVNDREVYYDGRLFSMKFLQVGPAATGGQLQVGQLQANAVIVPAFTTGRVGFRLANQEHGRFSRCRVRRL